MKKSFLFLFLLLALIKLLPNYVNANESKYYSYTNLLQFSDILVSDDGIPYMKDEVSIDTDYLTFLFSDKYIQDNKEIVHKKINFSYYADGIYKTENLFVYDTLAGLNYIYFDVSNVKKIRLSDLLARNVNENTLLLNEVILYEGDQLDFQGFKKYVRLPSTSSYVGNTINIYTGNDNPLSKENFKNMIKSYDNVLGDITNSINIEYGDYLTTLKADVYPVTITSTDGNNITKTICNINLIDKIPPVITGPDKIEWKVGEASLTESNIIKRYSAVDESSKVVKISIDKCPINFFQDTREENLVVRATDEAGNSSTINLKAIFIDTEPPVLVCDDVTIGISKMGIYDPDDLKDYVFEIELYDDSYCWCDVTIDNSYFENGCGPGVYRVTFELHDDFNNTKTEYRTLTIVDDIPPELYFESFVLETNSEKLISNEDLVESIKKDLKRRGILFEQVNLIEKPEKIEYGKCYTLKYGYTYDNVTNYELATINCRMENPNKYMYAYFVFPLLSIFIYVYFEIKRRKIKISRIK